MQVTHVTADAPERALLRNVQNYNSRHGCDLCKSKSVRVHVAEGRAKAAWPFSTANGEPRTDAWHREVLDDIDSMAIGDT